MRVDIWTFRDDIRQVDDPSDWITGYAVEATDGSIGKVEEVGTRNGTSYVVVDTGPWILGKKVVLPAQVIDGIDREERAIHVGLTRDDVKNAPEAGELLPESEAAFDDLGDYYRDRARR
jgi:hypothetical protein